MSLDRPFVYVNMAMTADGKITSAGREYPRFTSDHDRVNMDRLRAEADAVLMGAGTLRADDPELHVRDAGMREYRRSLGKPDRLLYVLVTSSCDVADSHNFFDSDEPSHRVIATVEGAAAERVADLERHAEVWRVGKDSVDLAGVLARLRVRGVERLLVEGGGELNWYMVDAGLVDEVYLTIAPVLLGGRDAPTWLEGRGFEMSGQRRLRLVDLRRAGDELYCRFAVET